jgi:hypothetical protein
VARFDELPLKIERCGVVNASEMDEVEDHGLVSTFCAAALPHDISCCGQRLDGVSKVMRLRQWNISYQLQARNSVLG